MWLNLVLCSWILWRVLIGDGDRERPAGCQPASRSGDDLTVQLDVPWNAPEVLVNMESAGLYELDSRGEFWR